MRDLVLALIGVIVVCVGVGLVYVPAGVIAAGVSLIVVAYVDRYLEAKRANS